MNIFKEEDGKISKQEAKAYSIALNKTSKVDDLKQMVADLSGIEKDRLLVTNYNGRSGMIETRFKDS